MSPSPDAKTRLDVRWLCAGGALVALSRWLVHPAWPDSTDALGFVLGMSGAFDLARFQPQFPGYPLFVWPGRALVSLGLSGVGAATLLSALASGCTAAALGRIADRLAGPRAALGAMALHAVAFGPWWLGSSALSESLGLALAAASICFSLDDRSLLAGVCGGLLLGARASYAPLLIAAALLSRDRVRLAIAAVLSALAWLLPFAAQQGARDLLALGVTHLRGHFDTWGGAVTTRPDLSARLFAFARGLFFDGLAPQPMALAAALLFISAAIVLPAPTRLDHGLVRRALLLLAPYALWVFFGQNLLEQPRHLLPLAEGLIVVAACVAGPRQPLLLASCSLAVLAASLPLLLERKRTPPAGVQAAEWLLQRPDSARTLIAAGRSARIFRAFAAPVQVQEHAALSDLTTTLARMPVYPRAIFVTDEIDLRSGRPELPIPARWHTLPGPTFCRDPRLDRARPCLTLTQLAWSTP
ncbi:MAG: hypothetical protein JST92_17935 [Deltaproteobacteria bacterium]|nr:hypothetical protein [Deltaproteobacteria bacterium]